MIQSIITITVILVSIIYVPVLYAKVWLSLMNQYSGIESYKELYKNGIKAIVVSSILSISTIGIIILIKAMYDCI